MRTTNLAKLVAVMCLLASGCVKQPQEHAEDVLNSNRARMENGLDLSKFPTTEIIYLGQKVAVKEADEFYILEGDILLNKRKVDSANKVVKISGAGVNGRRWPNNTVYYRINPALANVQRVYDAIDHIQNNTNLRFELNNSTPNYIEIIPSADNPYSDWIGYNGGRQVIGLPDWASVGNVIHEFNHAVGIFHEQTRADRDNSIIVNYTHIPTDEQTVYQYKKYTETTYSGFDYGSFDFNSIMLYSSSYYNGGWSMTDLNMNPFFAQRDGLSATDISLIDYMYPVEPQITGSSTVCSSANYSITGTGVHTYTPVTWAIQPTNAVSALSGTGNTVTIIRDPAFSGQAGLSATYTHDGLTVTKYKTITFGAPTNLWGTYVAGGSGTSRPLSCNNCLRLNPQYPNMYNAEVSITASSVTVSIVSKSPSTAIVQLLSHGGGNFSVNARGNSTIVVVKFVVSNSCGSYSQNYRFSGNSDCACWD